MLIIEEHLKIRQTSLFAKPYKVVFSNGDVEFRTKSIFFPAEIYKLKILLDKQEVCWFSHRK